MNRRTLLRWLTVTLGATAGLLAETAFGSSKKGNLKLISGDRQSTEIAKKQCLPTGSDIEGPYYLSGAPYRTMLASPKEPGKRIVIRGTVFRPNCKTPIAGALLDVWQADARGKYHSKTEKYRLRGRILTNAKGAYEFESIRPGRYKQDSGLRPAHIHFIIRKSGYQPLTTQLYFKGDPYLAPNDSCGDCGSDDPTHIIQLQPEKKGGVQFSGRFDIVLKPTKN